MDGKGRCGRVHRIALDHSADRCAELSVLVNFLGSGLSPAATARQFAGAFAGQVFFSIIADDRRSSGRARVATLQSPRLHLASIGKESHLRVGEQLDLAHQSLAPTMPACSSRSVPQTVTNHTERVRVLESLSWRVER